MQAGPLELGLASVARTLGGGPTGFAIILDLICTAAFTALALSWFRGSAVALLAFGAGAAVLGLMGAGYSGHPAELLIAVLWILAAQKARNGHTALAGALVGASACLELWGILGVTVFALAADRRGLGRGLALAVAMPVAALLPFVLGGDFHMLSYRWVVLRGIDRLVIGAGRPFTWYDRLVEGAVTVSIGFTVGRLVRGLRESVWIVPAATVLVRMCLDPVSYGYYWNTPVVILLIGATAILVDPRGLRLRLEQWARLRA